MSWVKVDCDEGEYVTIGLRKLGEVMIFLVVGLVILISWIIFALTHPVLAARRILIGVLVVLGVGSVTISGIAFYLATTGQDQVMVLAVTLPLTVLCFVAVNRLQARWN